MPVKTIQDILPLVEKPSQYIGDEINSVRKDWQRTDLKIALVFPDLYEIGTSHFGIQILYDLLNKQPDILAERAYAPGIDMEKQLRSHKLPLAALESGKPLSRFDIVGFSLLYELTYTNVLTILELSGIPLLASERDVRHPFLIAGGPCTCNPEPVADFFDALVVGDGEEAILSMSRAWLEWNSSEQKNRDQLLKAWSTIEGVYIPSFFETTDDASGFQRTTPLYSEYATVRRTVLKELETADFPQKPVLPFGRPVHDRLRLELARGCTRGCRFCQAGMIYRPVRERSVEKLLAIAEQSLASTGYEDISLLSLSTGDYSCLTPLIEQLMKRYAHRHVAVSLPSLRAGTLTPQLMERIKEVRKTGFTIAPEAGSQRLRNVINKNIEQEEIVKTVEDAFRLGWTVIKLYFMIGLPTETWDDLREIVSLVHLLRKTRGPKGARKKINVSFTTFIPKPHVPFQWASQISLAESKDKIDWLRSQLKMSNVQVKWQNPEMSQIEGLFARGDRRLSRLLIEAHRKGCRLDGWAEHFRYDQWQQAMADAEIDQNFYTERVRDIEEPLPWDHIESRVTKAYLVDEWKRSRKEELTPDCRTAPCNDCGVCDFTEIEPQVCDGKSYEPDSSTKHTIEKEQLTRVCRVTYEKTGNARFFGHLEMVNIFLRAVKRAKIAVKYSMGFHPKPRISFDQPLPLGIESLAEEFLIHVDETLSEAQFVQEMNQYLPSGLRVIHCRFQTGKPTFRQADENGYFVKLKNGRFSKDALEAFQQRPDCIFQKQNHKGKTKTVDIKKIVKDLEILASNRMVMVLHVETGKTLRPSEAIEKIFDLSEDEVKTAHIVKMPPERISEFRKRTS